MNIDAVISCLPLTARACFRCIREQWGRRPLGASSIIVTFDQFVEAGARRGSIPSAITKLEAVGLIARAGFVKRPRGHPAVSYRLLVD